MCPSYMATREEQHSTRGRANVLRLTIAGRLGESGLGDQGVYESLDLCLECRACKAECPVGVDVARFKSEFLADYWQRQVRRSRARSATWLAADGAVVSRRCQWIVNSGLGRRLNEQVLGTTVVERCPNSSDRLAMAARDRVNRRRHRTSWFSTTPSPPLRPRIGLATLDVPRPPAATSARRKPLLWTAPDLEGTARRCAGHGVTQHRPAANATAGRRALLRAELSLGDSRDAAPLRGEERRRLTSSRGVPCCSKSLSPLECQRLSEGRPEHHPVPGHCHRSRCRWSRRRPAVLDPNTTVVDLDAGCRGMAGSFGYAREHYDVSRAIGERNCFPRCAANLPAPWWSWPARAAGIKLWISPASPPRTRQS